MHIGSQIFRVSDFQKGFLSLLSHVKMFKLVLGFPPEFIDIGGGIGLDYETGDTAVSLNHFSKALSKLVGNPDWPDEARLILEPGRALVGNAGVLLTRVLYLKESTGRRWAIVDAGMNDFMRTALYRVKRRIVSLTPKRGRHVRHFLGGPICESSDVFGKYILPRLRKGDLLASQCRSGRVRLSEKRESLDDVFRRQVWLTTKSHENHAKPLDG